MRAIRSALIEDDAGVAEFIKAALSSRGHEVAVFGDAESAWAAHQDQPFQLMVLDWVLPGMDGLELCRRVRALPGGEAVVVLMVTGRDQRADLDAVLHAGASDYVAKPVELQQLLIRIAVAEHRIEETCRRLRVEAELQTSEQTTRALLEAIPDLILRVCRDGRVVAYHAPRRSGLDRPDGPAEAPVHLTDLVPAEAAGWCMELVATALRTRTPQLTEFPATASQEAKHVEARFVSCGPEEVLVILRDVTERRRMEQGLVQAARMVSMGTLASSVAHEMGCPLANLVGSLERLRQIPPQASAADPDGADGHVQLIEEARESAERVERIVRALSAFVQTGARELAPVNVHRAIDSALQLVRSSFPPGSRLLCSFGEVQPVMGDESRLCQVFLNMLANAAEALTDASGASEIEISTWISGGEVLVEIRDTGGGMTPETQGRVFEPFFSTKPSAGRIGLGLTISQAIVRELGGEISVESAPGEGSSFRVSLPAIDNETSTEAGSRGNAAGGLRVLVIDDDPLVLAGLRRLLEGCRVVVARGGQEALEQCRESWFDLVLCDVMMPGRSGLQLYDELRRERPDLAMRFVFMTGTSDAEVMLSLHQSSRPWVEKPFTWHEVVNLLHELHLKPSAETMREN